ncbi:MAG: sugar phosphate isomerase/epimerase family protein, partial [Armatimonadota bacterium]
MKVGISGIITPREWSFEETVRNAKQAGYEALEVCLRGEGELSLQTSEEHLQEMAQFAEEQGVELSSVCAQLRGLDKDIMTNDTEVWQNSIENIRRSLNQTAALGVDTMLLTMGSLNDELYYNEAYANSLKALQIIAPHAENAGVNLALEYVWNKFLLSPMEFARFCDEVASPRVGLFFDTGNMVIFGFPQHWVRICGKHLMKVHFKDFQREGYEWKPLLEGDVNFPAVMKELRKIGYDGALL